MKATTDTGKVFPNGFTSWQETHFEIVSYISRQDEDGVVGFTALMGGTGALYELAEDWTDEFERLNQDKGWDGEFFDEIELFCNQKNKPNEGKD
jgi:mevalonate pyrophosphate decarboxylase